MSSNSNSRSRKGEMVGMEFKPAKGGAVSETHMRYKRGGQGGGPTEDHEHETAVHPTLQHAQDHMAAMMGHCFTDGEGKSDEKPE